METLTGLFSAFGLSASAGLNAYIPLLAIALVARFTDWIELSPPWDMLSNPWIIGLIAVLALIEFFADKAPVINHINDIIQTFVRPIAGAIAFAASAKVITDVHPLLSLAMGLLVAGSHAHSLDHRVPLVVHAALDALRKGHPLARGLVL